MVHSMLNNDLRHYSTATAVSEVSIQVSERKQQQINKSISLSRSCTFKDAPLLSFKGGKRRENWVLRPTAQGHKSPQCWKEEDAMSGC